MRGKLKAGHVQEGKIHLQHEAIREKNKLALLKDFKKAKEQTQTMTEDLEFLSRIDGKFDPFESAITGSTAPAKPDKIHHKH